jgi:hypothetical protein
VDNVRTLSRATFNPSVGDGRKVSHCDGFVRGQHSTALNADGDASGPARSQPTGAAGVRVRTPEATLEPPPDQQPPAHRFPRTTGNAGRSGVRLSGLVRARKPRLAEYPAVSLRSGRTGRRPRRREEHRTRRFPDMVMIRDRPAEVTGRLVPGHSDGTQSLERAAVPPSAHWSNGARASSSSCTWQENEELRICAGRRGT